MSIYDRPTAVGATMKLDDSTALSVKTTLYELITALQTVVTPDRDELVVATVREMLIVETGQTASRILVEFRLFADDTGHGEAAV